MHWSQYYSVKYYIVPFPSGCLLSSEFFFVLSFPQLCGVLCLASRRWAGSRICPVSKVPWVKRSLHARMLTPSKLLATTGRCLYKCGQGSPPAAIPPPPPAPSPQPHHRQHVGVGRPGHHLHDQDHQVRQSHQDPQRCMHKILPHIPFGLL